MALNDLLNSSQIETFKECPDLFIDFLLSSGNPQNFKFYFYQRVLLRKMAHNNLIPSYLNSDSLLPMMALMVQCILCPHYKLSIPIKDGYFVERKIQEVCALIPAFNKEIEKTRGISIVGKKRCRCVFKNGSSFSCPSFRATGILEDEDLIYQEGLDVNGLV